MAANDPFLDELEDPAPDDVGAPDDRKLKNVLPLRSHLVVDGKKYEGERVSRGNAEVPTFEFEEDPEHDGLDEPAVHEDVAMDGSDEAKDDSPSESDDDQIMIEKEAEIRKGEEAISARLAEEKARETKRAEAVKNQTAIHDSIVDVRIRLEQVLSTVRGFPTVEDRNDAPDWTAFLSDDNEAVKDPVKVLSKLSKSFDTSFKACCPETVTSDASFSKWRNSVMDKWGTKVNEAEGVTPKGGFKAFDASVSAQLRATLASGKHMRKSRKVRVAIPLHGNAGEIPEGNSELHYDDRELYRSLLQEIIESGDGDVGGLRYAKLAKSGKVKKKIDRSGSKARKLRYVVHDKLVGFLAPQPLGDPGPLDEIIAGMFGVVK